MVQSREGSNEEEWDRTEKEVPASETMFHMGTIKCQQMVQGSKQVWGGRWLLPFAYGQMALFILSPSHLPASAQRSKLNLQHSVTCFFFTEIKGKLWSKL